MRFRLRTQRSPSNRSRLINLSPTAAQGAEGGRASSSRSAVGTGLTEHGRRRVLRGGMVYRPFGCFSVAFTGFYVALMGVFGFRAEAGVGLDGVPGTSFPLG